MSHCPRFALSHSCLSTMASTAAMAAFSSRNRRSPSWGWRSTSRGKLDLELGLRGATHSGERQRCRRSSLLGLLEEFQQRSFHFWCPESELENGREAELSTSVHCGVSQLQDVCYYPSCATTRYKKLLNGFTTGGRGDRGTHEEKNFYASFEKDEVPMCIELPLGQILLIFFKTLKIFFSEM